MATGEDCKEVIITGESEIVQTLIIETDKTFNHGKIVKGPGQMRFFWLDIIQLEACYIQINGDEKINQLDE